MARAGELDAAGRSIVHMEVGEPDFPTAPAVRDFVVRQLTEQRVGYTASGGTDSLRRALARLYRDRYELELDWRRILITPGSSGALQLAVLTLFDPGDRLLQTDPGYPCNTAIASLAGVNSDWLRLSAESGYRPQPGDIRAAWGAATRGLLLASPSNPTGVALQRDELEAVAGQVAEQGGYLLLDEIYHGLNFEGPPVSALQVSDEAIVVSSFSKYFGLTGWRVGWIVLPETLVCAAERIAQNLYLAAPTAGQWAAQAALLPELQPEWQRRRDQFAQRRDYLLPELERLGFRVNAPPQGAFYIYADASAHTSRSHSWCLRLLEEAGVVVTPGADFTQAGGESMLRFAFTTDLSQLREAVRRLAAFV